jgi:hypothetical protein
LQVRPAAVTLGGPWTSVGLHWRIPAVPRTRTILLVLLPFLLHGLAREVDRALGLVLRAQVEPESVAVEVARALATGGPPALARVCAWGLGGLVLWAAIGLWRSRREGARLGDALSREAGSFTPLLLRPSLTVLALASVALRSSYPYGFTLPVALTQDWGSAQDMAALAAVVTLAVPMPRWPAPSAKAVFLISFLIYALLAPGRARWWDGHPGNEPKYLRMGVALGHDLTLDAEGVSAAMEDLDTKPFLPAAARAVAFLARESVRMTVAAVRGAAGRDAIRATRIVRQTVRGKEGGVYYVLAPGPSLMLAPTLRLDRALNRARGVEGRLAVSVLAWNALASLLVASLFRLLRDATGRPGLAAALAFAFALLPPFLFYFFQFYPEMPGALVLAVLFHGLTFSRASLRRHPWRFGGLLATLPWLHQKFLPVWLVLVVTALWVGWRRSGAPDDGAESGASLLLAPIPARWRWAMGLLVPQAVSLYLTALYNFAITGSVRPDALFLAWGPGGVTTARLGQGLLGLLLDARYGILPYVPLLALAAAGLVVGGARRFAAVLPAAAVYYLTVASADNWAGAVCNLGRYVLPVAPLAVALVGLAVGRVSSRRGAAALVLVLGGWSALLAVALWRDPLAANDSALLLAKSAYADGHQYVPDLFLRHWSDAAPGLFARVVFWLIALAVGACWLGRAARAAVATAPGRSSSGGAGGSPRAALAGLSVFLLAGAFTLEQWPTRRAGPVFADALSIGPGIVAFLGGAASVREDEAVIGPGDVSVLVRAGEAEAALPVTVGGQGMLQAPGRPPLVLRTSGARVDLPLTRDHVVHGVGHVVVFSRTTLKVDGQAVLRSALATVPGGEGGPARGPTDPSKGNRAGAGYVQQ